MAIIKMDKQKTNNQKPKSTTKTKDSKCGWGCEETVIFIHCWWECTREHPLWKTVQRLLKELKIDLPYNPTISCLSIRPKEFKTRYHRDTNIPILIAIVSVIPKMWKQTKCPLIDKQINKNVHTLIHYLALKKKEVLQWETAWIHLEDIMLNKISQSQKGKYYMIPLLWCIWNNQIHKTKE